MIDPLESAKLNEDGDQVAKADAEAEFVAALHAEMDAMGALPRDSLYAAMVDDGMVFEVAKKAGIPNLLDMTADDRRRALEALRRIREREQRPAPAEHPPVHVNPPVPEERPHREPRPAPAVPTMDSIDPSVDGVYVARVAAGSVKVPMSGGIHVVRDGTEMDSASYLPRDFDSCLSKGVVFEPRVPLYRTVTMRLRVPDGVEPVEFEAAMQGAADKVAEMFAARDAGDDRAADAIDDLTVPAADEPEQAESSEPQAPARTRPPRKDRKGKGKPQATED